MRKNSSEGFSLIETIVAIFVVSIIMSSIYYLMNSQNNNLLSRKQNLNNFILSTNSYAELYLLNKVEDKLVDNGQTKINDLIFIWKSKFTPTIVDNIFTFEYQLIQQNETSENTIKTDLFFYQYEK